MQNLAGFPVSVPINDRAIAIIAYALSRMQIRGAGARARPGGVTCCVGHEDTARHLVGKMLETARCHEDTVAETGCTVEFILDHAKRWIDSAHNDEIALVCLLVHPEQPGRICTVDSICHRESSTVFFVQERPTVRGHE